MTSLRELIEGKARRKRHLPILVGDAAGATARVAAATNALNSYRTEHPEPESDDEGKRLRDELAAALQEQARTTVLVELQSLPDDEWDALFGELEPDAEGEIDLDDVRAAMLAASCTDPDLQDVGWWEGQLSRPEWSKGDKLAINNLLLDLNLRVPVGPPGKG